MYDRKKIIQIALSVAPDYQVLEVAELPLEIDGTVKVYPTVVLASAPTPPCVHLYVFVDPVEEKVVSVGHNYIKTPPPGQDTPVFTLP